MHHQQANEKKGHASHFRWTELSVCVCVTLSLVALCGGYMSTIYYSSLEVLKTLLTRAVFSSYSCHLQSTVSFA